MPYSLAVFSNHIYVGDLANPVVRDITNNLAPVRRACWRGTTRMEYSGNGGPAASAMINGAGAVASCGGDTYIADTLNYVIRKIDGSGVITTVAGTGQPGFSGDGGPGTKAQLSPRTRACMPPGGGLYISDTDNGRVRILDGSGNIDTWWYSIRFPTGIGRTGLFRQCRYVGHGL